MIVTTAMLLEELKDYQSPASKLSRMVREGQYTRITKGLYETDPTTPGYLLAGSIYGPSYLSFEFALSYHGLIPEAVYTFTCATYDKKKKKIFNTPFGTFTYRDVPANVYHLGVELVREGTYGYWIASPEKALSDLLYTKSPVANLAELEQLIFTDLRIDEEGFAALDRDDLQYLAGLYGSTNVQRLGSLVRRI